MTIIFCGLVFSLSTVSTNMVGAKPHYIHRLYVPCVELCNAGLLRL